MNRDNHRVFLIRHGETDWNRQFRYQGSSDIPLNEDGLEQARRVGVRLSSVTPAAVLTSPLLRASRTAEIIAEQNGAELRIEELDELREISFGIWEGLTIPEIKKLDGETFERWKSAPFTCAPEGGEMFAEIMERSKSLKADICARPAGEDTFIVAHGGVLRALAAVLLGFKDIDLMWRMRFDNCSVSIIDLWPKWEGRSSMLLTNDTHHLRMEGDDEIASLIFPL